MPLLVAALALQTLARERAPYRFDFTKTFYATPAAVAADERRVDEDLSRLEGYRGRLGKDPKTLRSALELSERIAARTGRLLMYHHLRYMVDTRNDAELRADNALTSRVSSRTSFFELELGKLSAAQAARPELRPFAYQISEARRRRKHTLPESQERLVRELQPQITGWQQDLYERSRVNGVPQRDASFFATVHLIEGMDRLAKLRGYANGVEESLDNLHLTRQQVSGMLDALAGLRPLAEQVAAVQARLATRRPLPTIQFDLSQGISNVRMGLAPLGPAYLREFDAIVNPANGRMDVAGGPARASLGTGWGMAWQPTVLYWPEYTGTLDDVMRGLSHEGGHAVHIALMYGNHVPQRYFDGPGYFFESFAMLNQILVAESLARNEADPERKAVFFRQLINEASFAIHVAAYASIEYAMHDAVRAGRVHTPDDFDAIERREWARFHATSRSFNPRNAQWWNDAHFVSAPLYEINYVVASLLALKYYDMLQRDPAGFLPRYLGLMRNGFDAPPAELLRRYLGLDISKPAFVREGFDLLRKRLPEYRELVESLPVRG